MLPQLLVMPIENKESVAEQKYYSLVIESLEEFKIVFEELIRYALCNVRGSVDSSVNGRYGTRTHDLHQIM